MKQLSNGTMGTHFESLYPKDTRFEEVKKILNFIKSGSSCEIIALPGVGKNNLLGLLSYNRDVRVEHLGENQKWFHFVYMDFSEVRKRSLFDVVKFMLISTAYSLSERNMKAEYERVHAFLKEAIDLQDELVLFHALKKSIDYLAIEKELTIVFLMDRFEQYISDVTDQFFLNLKILRNRAKYRFSTVFALTRPLEDLLEPSVFSEFYEFLSGHNVYLRLHDVSGLAFRFAYLEKVTGKKASEKIKQEIIDLCGGHGKLCRLSYEAILASSKEKRLASSSQMKTFLLEKNAIKGALSDIWNSLVPSEQTLLTSKSYYSSYSSSDPEPVEGESRSSSSSRQARTVNSEVTYSYLEHVGLVHNGKITLPLFEEFVKTMPVQKAEALSYDEQRNEILKANVSLTDRLSPSEFRLLRFLIQNPDRVCEKDELIAAVWRDSKTQEGVTDQALDQIIYRLRRKIEENPNSPVHIQTIKGRGVKFTP